MTEDNGAGYKQPPKSARFTTGQSGNPRGRPKGTRNLKTDLNDLMNKRIVVRENGSVRNISRQEAVLLGLFGKAAQGDVRASTNLINMVMKLNPEATEKQRLDTPENDQWIIDDFLRRHGVKLTEE
jgi:hypothetical protein